MRSIPFILSLLSLAACQSPLETELLASKSELTQTQMIEQQILTPTQEPSQKPVPKASPNLTKKLPAKTSKLGEFQLLGVTSDYVILATDTQAFVLSIREDLPTGSLLELKDLQVKGQGLSSKSLRTPDDVSGKISLFAADDQLVFRVALAEHVHYFTLRPVKDFLYQVQAVTEVTARENIDAQYNSYFDQGLQEILTGL